MHLKRLEIQGFKTFAAHTVFEFRPGITAVIGPNGSGKSNLNDAVRWVLGEQSYAALRSRRTEDIIFSGGGRRAPSGFAEVSLTVDNSDRLLDLPYGEVTITRRATRAGDNEYYINRSRVRLRDVQEAVGPLGGSYTIINQGLVDAALTLRPEERRRLFEDAAEIGTFVARKNDAESKLRETSANMARSADLLAELEPRLRSLKRQAALARSYRELADELRALLVQHYREAWHAAQAARHAAETQKATLAAGVESRRAAQATATAELRAARASLAELREQLGMLHSESSALHTQAEAAQRDLAVGAERAAALNRRDEDAERQRRELGLRHEELSRERAAIAARLAEAEQRLAAAAALVAGQQQALAAGEQARQRAQQQLEQAQREEAAAAAAGAEAERRAGQITSRRTTLQREQSEQASNLANAQQLLAACQAALEQATRQLSEAQNARSAAASAEEVTRRQIEQLRSQRASAEEALAAARRAVADLDARLESLGRLQRSFAGTFAGVRAAMQWAEQQRRVGFALVSSIVQTPGHLETAIEVALGSRIQNIVVERWGDAEDAIAALKHSGAGRATFLPLDSIRRSSESAPPERGNGVLGVAAQLVAYDAHYEDVVWNLLGRTLVVEDLPTARRVLRGRSGGWTIVTLSGEQVNSGGAVTGGAQIKEAGVLRRERELRELPDHLEQARATVAASERARSQNEQAIQQAERSAREAEQTRRRAAQQLEQARESEAQTRRDSERAEHTLELERRRHDQATAELALLEEQAAMLAAERSALAERAASARETLTRLREADTTRAEQERAAQSELASLLAAQAAAEAERRAEHALLQSHDQQLARLDGQAAEAEQRRAEQERERQALQARLAELDTAHAALLAQIDTLRSQIGPAETELAALEQRRSQFEQRESEATAALLESESAHGRALVDTQRARDRLDTLWERAAADDIDMDTLPAAPENEPVESDTARAEQITALRQRVARLGAVNPLALEEYDEANQRYEFMASQLADLEHAADSLRTLISELDGAMRMRFEATFAAIAVEFEARFVRLFGGGEAKLSLVGGDSTSETTEGIDRMGIDITVRPPGKRQQNIALLSGGERALTAAALLFAILVVNPSPFCILDEVDAALDEANVGRFRAMLADLGAQTQFLLVTHNRGTIEVADTIYGISMGDDGASRMISVRLEELGVE